jgi:uncharacterized protein YqgV (UPF0045/DUF77 family)
MIGPKKIKMRITVEISYYPLNEEFEKPILDFIKVLEENSNVKIKSGHMSTLVGGEYEEVMLLLTKTIKPFMEQFPSVFAMRITNACNTFI